MRKTINICLTLLLILPVVLGLLFLVTFTVYLGDEYLTDKIEASCSQ